MKQKIDRTQTGLHNYPKRRRVCQFEGCEAEAKAKWCEEHARETMLQQKRDRSRKNWKKTQKSQRSVAKRQNDDRLDAIAKEPKHLTASDIMHDPPEKAAKKIDAILNGERGYVGA